MSSSQGDDPPCELAGRLHTTVLRLLRQLRSEDAKSGLSAPRLSALSVIVHAGPLTLTRLATVEQVRKPTVSRMVRDLESEGLVRRRADSDDRRVQWLVATSKGRRRLARARARREQRLAVSLDRLPNAERERIAAALPALARLLETLGSNDH